MKARRPQWNFAGVANQLTPQVRTRLLSFNLLVGSLGGSVILGVAAATSVEFDVLHPVMIGFIVVHLAAVFAALLPRLSDHLRAATLAVFCLMWACVVLAYTGPRTVTALYFVILVLLAGFLYGAPGLFGSFVTIILLYTVMAILWVDGYLPLSGSQQSDPSQAGYWVQTTVSFVAATSMICVLVNYLLRRTTEYFHQEVELRESLLQEKTLRSEAELVQLRTELARRDAERLLATIYRAAPIGLAFVRDRQLVLVNDWVAARLGASPEALVGLPTRSLYVSEDEYDRVGRVVTEAFSAGSIATVEAQVRAASGSALPVLLTAAPLDPARGDGGALVVTISDITALKAASDAVRESEARLSEIFEHTGEIIFAASVEPDDTFRITRVNRAAARYGLSLAQLNSGNCRTTDLYPADVAWDINADFRQCVQTRAPLTTVRTVPMPSGPVKFSTTLVPVFDPATQRAVRLVGFSRDLSHTERIDELQRSKLAADAANQAKSSFLSRMSHEIRTPLNAVLGFTRLLLRDDKLSDNQRAYLETVDRNGEHLLNLINDILEISKIEAAKVILRIEPCAIRRLLDYLEATFGPAVKEKGLCFTTHCADGVPAVVMTDEGKLRQILVNLVGNAVKFTATGSVRVALRARAGVTGGTLCVEVMDTGPGLSADEQAALFQDFNQTEAGRRVGGSGLGLTISREHARLLGGDISVSSVIGQGSIFTVSIPYAEDAPAAPGPSAGTAACRRIRLAPGTPPVRLLVVDDISDNRLLLSSLLREAGFVVREATNGQEATQAAAAWQPHCALIDMKMPGLDGIGVTRLLRGMPSLSRLKILGISASVFSSEAEEFLAAGADAFLPKPVSEDEIMSLLGRLLKLDLVADAPVVRSAESAQTSPGSRISLVRRTALGAAAEQADYNALVRLTADLAADEPELARLVDRYLQRFDYEGIRRLLAEVAEP